VEFIEQPLAREASDEDKRHVYLHSALPIIADEDCQTWSDVERCHGLYHGINVKICKCGGLTPALGMLRLARQLGMKTMVGCMIESSIGISGAAQLLPMLDYTDLDGAVLLKDEPATGVRIERGVVVTSSLPGTGAALDKARLGLFQPLPPDHSSS
jgi:L-alanine-DL-glutamate epimerase-like enolase superfamily enzyme